MRNRAIYQSVFSNCYLILVSFSTESRSQRDLKIGISGSSFLSGENRAVKKSECKSASQDTESANKTSVRDEVDLGDATGGTDEADVKFV